MKKLPPLSLAALLTLSGPVLAQSTVSLYGTLDVGLLSISNLSAGTAGYIPSAANGGSAFRVKDGGLGASNWGLKGQEDLGGGLKATFQLQGNINVKDGTSGGPNSSNGLSMFNQMAVVGLSGGFGELKVGRQVSPMYWAMASTDARGARYFGSALTGLVGLNSASRAWIGNNSNVAFGTIYNDNALVYTTPTWNNVTVNVAYAFGEVSGSGKADSQQTVTALYNANGLKLSALYYNGYGNNLSSARALYTAASGGNAAAASAALAAAGFTPTANTNRLASLGALYNWSAFTVSGQYYMARNPAHALVPGGSDSLDMWTLAGAWRAAPNINVSAGYYAIKDNKNIGNKATQFAVGAEYFLSKRTIMYAQAASVTNKGANMNLSPVYASPVTANKNVSAYMMGVRHSF